MKRSELAFMLFGGAIALLIGHERAERLVRLHLALRDAESEPLMLPGGAPSRDCPCKGCQTFWHAPFTVN